MAPGITTGPSIAGGQSLRIPLGSCHFLRSLEWNIPSRPGYSRLTSSIFWRSVVDSDHGGYERIVPRAATLRWKRPRCGNRVRYRCSSGGVATLALEILMAS